MTSQEKEIYKKTLELFDNECALCGDSQVALHHIRYGACGRKTYMGNVIPLCPFHHRMAHSDKKTYQPMLIMLVNERLKDDIHNI